MRATGAVLPPILGKDRKKEILHEECRKLGISPQEAITVGDGANDLPMLQAAGAGVAYHAKPNVIAGTQFHVRHGDLTALLFLQGYKRRIWAAGA
jgi:phosphoserine phosphatase